MNKDIYIKKWMNEWWWGTYTRGHVTSPRLCGKKIFTLFSMYFLPVWSVRRLCRSTSVGWLRSSVCTTPRLTWRRYVTSSSARWTWKTRSSPGLYWQSFVYRLHYARTVRRRKQCSRSQHSPLLCRHPQAYKMDWSLHSYYSSYQRRSVCISWILETFAGLQQ